MQRTTSNLQPAQQGSTRAHAVVLTAITLFALSGLMVGFAFGAFNRQPQSSNQPNTTSTGPTPTSTTISKATTPTPTQPPQDIALGCPGMTANTGDASVADNATVYQVDVQVLDKTGYTSGQKCQFHDGTNNPLGNPVKADGVMCKIWLMDASTDKMNDFGTYVGTLKAQDDLKNPFPNEIQSSLIFDPTTPQLQSCKQGTGEWKFKFASTLKPGNYYLIGYTNWKLRNHNWNWVPVQIK